MRQGSNHKRLRGRGNVRKHSQPSRSQTFDSNGPGGRIRGNAYQVFEKYLALARDAQSTGDRVMAENYFQHAEHYFRIVNINNEDGGARPSHRRTDGFGASAGTSGNGRDATDAPAVGSADLEPESTDEEQTPV